MKRDNVPSKRYVPREIAVALAVEELDKLVFQTSQGYFQYTNSIKTINRLDPDLYQKFMDQNTYYKDAKKDVDKSLDHITMTEFKAQADAMRRGWLVVTALVQDLRMGDPETLTGKSSNGELTVHIKWGSEAATKDGHITMSPNEIAELLSSSALKPFVDAKKVFPNSNIDKISKIKKRF